MQEVPVTFFARDFDFAHPDTFTAVCGDGSVPASLVRRSLRARGARRACWPAHRLFLSHPVLCERALTHRLPCHQSLVLQERLSGYTDAVECHLQVEICARSDSFFEALGVLTDLSHGIAATRTRVAALRHHVRALDETVMGAAVRLAQLQRRRRNVLALLATLRGVESLAQSLNDLQLLLEAGDFAGALDVLDDARKVRTAQCVRTRVLGRPGLAWLACPNAACLHGTPCFPPALV
jgi:hypothetical protein